MKKLFGIVLCLALVVVGSQNAMALDYSVVLDDYASDSTPAEVLLNITGDQTTAVTFEVKVIDPLADLRAVFFDFDNSIFPQNLDVSDNFGNVTDWMFAENNVDDLGNGAVINPYGPFDGGVEIGIQGLGDDYQYANFTITSTDVIDLGEFFAARLTSVYDETDPKYDPNDEDTWREGSSKIVGNYEPIPEPSTVFLLGIGLLGVLGLGRKLKK